MSVRLPFGRGIAHETSEHQQMKFLKSSCILSEKQLYYFSKAAVFLKQMKTFSQAAVYLGRDVAY